MKETYGTTELREIWRRGKKLGWDIYASPLRNSITSIVADVKDMTYDELVAEILISDIHVTNPEVTDMKNRMIKAGQLEPCMVKREIEVKGFRKVKKDEEHD